MSAPRSLPPGYVNVERSSGRAVVLEEAAEWATRALEAEASLYAWAGRAGAEAPEGGGGRGQVRIIPAADRSAPDQWVVRHYWRGGLMASLLGDRYLNTGSCRAFEELGASHRLRQAGVRTPVVVAAAEYPAGLYYRADLVTVWVPGIPLIEALSDAAGEELDVVLTRTAQAINDLAGAGAHHVDLNAHNLLVDDQSHLSPWILDLDRISFGVPPAEAKRRMAERLRRSLTKLEASPQVVDALFRRVGGVRGAA